MIANFEFDKSVQRYRYTSGDRNGQFVSFSQLEKLTADYQAQQASKGQAILQKLIDGDITTNDWMRETAGHLKTAHINMYALGFGGHQRMGAGEYGAIGNRLKGEYEYLRNFAQSVENGELSEQQIKARLNLYYQSTWQTYERARERSHAANGFTLERRITAPSENCNDCIGYEAKGWVDIGTLPAPGIGSVCKANCRCWKDFAREGEANLLSLKHGWIDQMPITNKQEMDAAPAAEMQPIGDSDRRQTNIDGMYWGPPDENDLTIIQKITGFEWMPEDWYMVPLQASDNFMWSSWECCWHSSVLVNMAYQFPGQALMEDHSSEAEDTEGFFTRSVLIQSQNPPLDLIESQGNGPMNRQQLSREGYLQVYLQAAIPASEVELINAMKQRKYQHVSTGSILNGADYICPHCSKALHRDVSFYELDAEGRNICPHEVPHPFTKMMADMGWFEEKITFADYAILKSEEGERHYETSLVYLGNLAGAQLVRPAKP